MRYHPEDKKKTRQRILSIAARRYRAEGLNAVGIANLMADLGMTHGGFYAHFTDKEELVAASCETAFQSQQRHWDKQLQNAPAHAEAFAVIVRDYLSRQHAEHPDNGCFAAALAGEMARRDSRSRLAFTRGIEQMLTRLNQLDGKPPSLSAEAALAQMLGALVLARAVSDRQLSERLLQHSCAHLLDAAGDQP